MKKLISDLKYRIEYIFIRLLVSLVNAFPIPVSYFLTQGLGRLIFYFLKKRRKITRQNLDRAYASRLTPAEKDKIAMGSFQSMTTSIFEFFRTPQILKQAGQMFEFTGTEHLDKAFARGRGVILVISHTGSWEYLSFLPNLRKYPCAVVTKTFKNPYLYRHIKYLREITSLKNIDKKNAAKSILAELKKNHLVAILIDQWAGIEGVWGPFFGEGTSSTNIPARLALRNGAALVPAYCLRKAPGRYEIRIEPEVLFEETKENPELEMTNRLNLLLEKQILRLPEQWAWGHSRWKGIERYQRQKPVAAPPLSSR